MVKHIHVHVGRKARDGQYKAPALLLAHPQFTQADYNYLRDKGWTNEEILKRWTAEHRKGVAPLKGNKNAKSGEPGYARDAESEEQNKARVRAVLAKLREKKIDYKQAEREVGHSGPYFIIARGDGTYEMTYVSRDSKGTKDESANAAGKLSPSLEKQIGREGSTHREDMPADVFLEPGTRKYPVKEKEDGGWKYSRSLLLAAAREARMHGHSALAKRADEIRQREFGTGDATPVEMRARLKVLRHQLEYGPGANPDSGEKSRPLRETVALRAEIAALERKLEESNA